jgi:competence protein ComEA
MLKELYQKYVLKYYKYILLGIFVIVSVLIFLLLKYREVNGKNIESSKEEEILSTVVEEIPKEESYYYVDIKGAVTNPNVYKVGVEDRIADVIKMAGGLTEQADTSTLNLSKKVIDEMFIVIYTKAEIAKFKEGNVVIQEVIKYIEKECTCPDPLINDACILNDSIEDASTTMISLNNATKEELMSLPGIGEAKAQDIIDYRVSTGPFKTIDDIKQITGIGDSIFDQIKDYITL